MRVARLQNALERLTAAIRDVEAELAAMEAEHDPLASHIFVSRRHYRNSNDTRSGRRAYDVGALKLANCLETRVSRQSGRMGAVDGCGGASVAHVYEVRSRKDHRGVDLISDALPLGRLWYVEPNAANNAVDYAKHRSCSHTA
jgi:hypothetical protein